MYVYVYVNYAKLEDATTVSLAKQLLTIALTAISVPRSTVVLLMLLCTYTSAYCMRQCMHQ
jgi:hypothetical protein